MLQMAIGLIETVGLVCAIEVADVMAKSANIKVLEYENTKGAGLITVKIVGDVSAVNTAISAGKAAGERLNKVYSSLVIPRISKEVYDKIISCSKEEHKEVITCNLCNDKACSRKKGELRNLCIHYNDNLNKEEDIKNE